MFEVYYALPGVAIIMALSFGLLVMKAVDEFKFAYNGARNAH